ncbi:MAG TPA: hypothetical protein ENK18_19100 [Deltaproteobacteria bacterium]|nr:hypothetical protein [Deltaproteobacteria bacterium]
MVPRRSTPAVGDGGAGDLAASGRPGGWLLLGRALSRAEEPGADAALRRAEAPGVAQALWLERRGPMEPGGASAEDSAGR